MGGVDGLYFYNARWYDSYLNYARQIEIRKIKHRFLIKKLKVGLIWGILTSSSLKSPKFVSLNNVCP